MEGGIRRKRVTRQKNQDELLEAAGSRADYRAWLKRFAKWLYNTDHIQVRYSVDFDGPTSGACHRARAGSFCCSSTSRSILTMIARSSSTSRRRNSTPIDL
ncbi:hypothetical protein LPN01_04985 [Sphingomonas sp. A2-49]|nr:hypothetical protein [Sphingomonas sp. A2-49]MCU6453427.1 hypothetical protein [Sphingomonas sp. A2-49]